MPSDYSEEEMDDLSQGHVETRFTRALEVDEGTPIGSVFAKIESMMVDPKELH